MMSIYRIFQIIFGIVVSVFILYFLIQYASNYAGFQEDFQRVTILKNLKITAESVYTYGNPVVFQDTAIYDFSSCCMQVIKPNPPSIKCGFGEVGPVFIPMLFSGGGEVVVEGSDLNLGWHLMHWVEVMPAGVILFNPLESSEDTWNLMKNLTSLLPSTENLDEKVTFGFCDGSSLLEDMCGGSCERYSFLSVLDSHQAPASKCTRSLGGSYTLVTISGQCSPAFSGQGVCVRPSADGVGVMYLAGSDKEFVYKDMFDIIALMIGGSGKDVFGKTKGERLYTYKNEVWKESVLLASQVMKQRALLVSSRYQMLNENLECIPLYANLANELNSVSSLVKGDYNNYALMRNLAARMKQAGSLYQSLIDLGCEYYV